MSENIDTIRAQLWEKMRDKPYRDTFVAAHLSTNIAAQIQTLREQRGWTKRELAQKTGMAPSRITVMEDPSYNKFTLTTLRRLASAFDVTLIARFAPFSDLVDWVATLSPEKLEVLEFDKDSLSPLAKKHAAQAEDVGIEADKGWLAPSIGGTALTDWPSLSQGQKTQTGAFHNIANQTLSNIEERLVA